MTETRDRGGVLRAIIKGDFLNCMILETKMINDVQLR
jgi:hypothetical protein